MKENDDVKSNEMTFKDRKKLLLCFVDKQSKNGRGCNWNDDYRVMIDFNLNQMQTTNSDTNIWEKDESWKILKEIASNIYRKISRRKINIKEEKLELKSFSTHNQEYASQILWSSNKKSHPITMYLKSGGIYCLYNYDKAKTVKCRMRLTMNKKKENSDNEHKGNKENEENNEMKNVDENINDEKKDGYEKKIEMIDTNCNGCQTQCKDGLDCLYYIRMKYNFEYTQENLNHFQTFDHFNNDYNEKPLCRYGDKCYSFVRVARLAKDVDSKNGQTSPTILIKDECHLLLYRHPPRVARSPVLYMNTCMISNQPMRTYTKDSDTFNPRSSATVHNLMIEMLKNGFEKDLFVETSGNNGNHNNENNGKDKNAKEISLLTILNKKLESDIHCKNFQRCLTRGEMLSIIMYTGCDCNYDLCKTQRNGDFKKWKIFDRCLNLAITKLHNKECYDHYNNGNGIKLYTGIQNTQLKKQNQFCYFMPTFVSCSYDKQVAMSFLKNNGMLVELDSKLINTLTCCCVEWISKFPEEKEILFARTPYDEPTIMTVLDSKLEINGLYGVEFGDEDPNKNLANHKFNNIQLVGLSSFKEKHSDIKLFSGYTISKLRNIFLFLFENKNEMIKLANDNEKYVNGINMLYNDKIFVEYKKDFENKIGYLPTVFTWSTRDTFITMQDLVCMQQKSQILCTICQNSSLQSSLYDIAANYGKSAKDVKDVSKQIENVKTLFENLSYMSF